MLGKLTQAKTAVKTKVVMVIPSLEQALKPYGINDAEDFSNFVSAWKSVEHARRVYRGERPLSLKIARRIKRKTNGGLTLDFLLSLNEQRPNS